MARPTDDPKLHRISVRVNDETWRKLHAIARQQGCSVGEVVRRLLAGETSERRYRGR